MGLMDYDELIILDSDNNYDNNGLADEIAQELIGDRIMLCGFRDEQLIPKWANAIVDKNHNVIDIVEKDPAHVTDPALVGVFGFGNTKLFKRYAKYILENIGTTYGNEYYMSSIPKMHARLGLPVWLHEVKGVVPMGTPEDVEALHDIHV